MPADLVTDRLVLRPPLEADREAFALMSADPEVMRFIGPGRPYDRATAERAFAMLLAHWDERSFGLRSALDRDTGEYLGFVGLSTVPAGSVGAGETEIGWRLRRTAQGRGLATEGATVVCEHARDALGLTRLVALIQPGNGPSQRVATKLGLRPERRGRGLHGVLVELWAAERPRRRSHVTPDDGGAHRV